MNYKQYKKAANQSQKNIEMFHHKGTNKYYIRKRKGKKRKVVDEDDGECHKLDCQYIYNATIIETQNAQIKVKSRPYMY